MAVMFTLTVSPAGDLANSATTDSWSSLAPTSVPGMAQNSTVTGWRPAAGWGVGTAAAGLVAAAAAAAVAAAGAEVVAAGAEVVAGAVVGAAAGADVAAGAVVGAVAGAVVGAAGLAAGAASDGFELGTGLPQAATS